MDNRKFLSDIKRLRNEVELNIVKLEDAIETLYSDLVNLRIDIATKMNALDALIAHKGEDHKPYNFERN